MGPSFGKSRVGKVFITVKKKPKELITYA